MAKELGYFEIDVEDYYFPEQKESRQAVLEGRYDIESSYLGEIPYSKARNKSEVKKKIGENFYEI